ncbi:Alpha-N-acetylglucosaminidase [Metarhizium brunneum]|uniref:Alpha-N-acetylglucosaminidase n=1 Tax=Metarhizium brunneum TaxID=500148 RepID=A0A7D5Z8J1_9HYPO
MLPTRLFVPGLTIVSSLLVSAESIDGIKALATRLFKGHGGEFEFTLTANTERPSRWNPPKNDNYTVSSRNGKIHIEGTTLSALARGLRHYSVDSLQLDEFLFAESHAIIPDKLPLPRQSLSRTSVVPWRYNLNTVTFSYSFVWYQWEDWEKLLDWAALRGTNIQLAWVGFEKIFLDSFRDLGMTDEEIIPFFSGPAFQAWNRFGNTQGSWGGVGNLSSSWIDSQFELQKKIVARMVDLGITPVLPAFPGFVPPAFSRVQPDANTTKAPRWTGLPDTNTRDTFLSPLDTSYARLQQAFISKQIEAFGNVTNIYTLDQFNEMPPTSNEPSYLSQVSTYTYKALTAANPAAVWLLQGWLFLNSGLWTEERVTAYLGGPEGHNSMLVLDLYSESRPQWQRTNGYFGRPWIWCQLHDFGGNMGMYGQISDITVQSMDALRTSPSLSGFGMTPEGYEGNEVVYQMLFDQAWTTTPIDTSGYFYGYVVRRYAGVSQTNSLFQAWDILRQNIYDNKDRQVPCVGVGIYQNAPSLSGLVNRTGNWPPPTKVYYDPATLKKAHSLLIQAANEIPQLWEIPTFQLDIVDVTRQVMSNAFNTMYTDYVQIFNSQLSRQKRQIGNHGELQRRDDFATKGKQLLDFLTDLDRVLATNQHFRLDSWLDAAQYWAKQTGANDLVAFNARSQITTWIWESEALNDYAAKEWSGLTRSYYRGRWSIFVDGLNKALETKKLDEAAIHNQIRTFEKLWQYRGFQSEEASTARAAIKDVLPGMMEKWQSVFK